VIAVLDDDESLRRALIRALRIGGYSTAEFARGEEFLKSWRLDPPACLILDLEMPGVSGLEVLQALQVAEAPFPVIVITAHDAPHVREQSMGRGAIAYLRKPVELAVLLETVTNALRQMKG
jgi:FixJ family two-component response regulator